MTEADWLAAAILFALREDWRSTPPALRNASGLYPAIAQRMAKSIHRAIGTDIELGGNEPHPTLRELFVINWGRWAPHQQAAALGLARAMKWTDAIETRVQLGKGNYRLEVGPGGVQVFLPGEVKAVTTGVHAESLLDNLAQCRWPADAQNEAKVRALFKGQQDSAMRMIPAAPYDTRSRAELVVFDCLRGLTLAGDGSHQGIAFHSLNLTRHPYKRFGEIDFLVTSPRGILVLEVKGGGVKCIDGRWVYTDRAGKEHTKNESPFRQAESALHGLIGRLQDRFLKRALDELVFGYGVIFPDCEWRQAGSEWDPHTLADAKAFRRFHRWLDSLYNYWRDKVVLQRKGDGTSASALQEIQSFLRPDFETIPALGSQVRQIDENLIRLTEDQYALLDIVEANPRTFCTGGAGTGKTLLAAELARRWTASGEQVLLVRSLTMKSSQANCTLRSIRSCLRTRSSRMSGSRR